MTLHRSRLNMSKAARLSRGERRRAELEEHRVPIPPEDAGMDSVLSADGARVAVLRVKAREDVVIAESVAQLLQGLQAPGAD